MKIFINHMINIFIEKFAILFELEPEYSVTITNCLSILVWVRLIDTLAAYREKEQKDKQVLIIYFCFTFFVSQRL